MFFNWTVRLNCSIKHIEHNRPTSHIAGRAFAISLKFLGLIAGFDFLLTLFLIIALGDVASTQYYDMLHSSFVLFFLFHWKDRYRLSEPRWLMPRFRQSSHVIEKCNRQPTAAILPCLNFNSDFNKRTNNFNRPSNSNSFESLTRCSTKSCIRISTKIFTKSSSSLQKRISTLINS